MVELVADGMGVNEPISARCKFLLAQKYDCTMLIKSITLVLASLARGHQ